MVALFLLAVVAVVVAVNLIACVAWLSAFEPPRGTRLAQYASFIPRSLFLWVSLATAAMIFLVSVVQVSKLASGGPAVAEMVGARRINPDTRDALERRLLNVVEEMAIASGVRVPAVYIMDQEPGINAFAAGWDVSGA